MNQEELKFDTTTGIETPQPMKSEPQIISDEQNHGEVLGSLIDEAQIKRLYVKPFSKKLSVGVEPYFNEANKLPDAEQATGKLISQKDFDESVNRSVTPLTEEDLKEQEAQQFLRYQNGLVRRRLHTGGSNYTPPKNKNKRRAEKKSRKKNR